MLVCIEGAFLNKEPLREDSNTLLLVELLLKADILSCLLRDYH